MHRHMCMISVWPMPLLSSPPPRVISRVSRDVFRQLTLQPTFLKLCVRAHKLCLVGMESTCSGDERDNPCPALMPQVRWLLVTYRIKKGVPILFQPIISVGFIERCRVQTIAAIQQSPPLMVQVRASVIVA